MREARPEGSPYPKADLWLRGLADGVVPTTQQVLDHAAKAFQEFLDDTPR